MGFSHGSGISRCFDGCSSLSGLSLIYSMSMSTFYALLSSSYDLCSMQMSHKSNQSMFRILSSRFFVSSSHLPTFSFLGSLLSMKNWSFVFYGHLTPSFFSLFVSNTYKYSLSTWFSTSILYLVWIDLKKHYSSI